MNASPRILNNILDIPDEILIEIILYLNARERVPLGNSCKRFNILVFEDKKLLRDLDFSKQGGLTSESDIHAYFNDPNKCKHIIKLNLRDVSCMRPEEILHIYIYNAINLVDINIHGMIIEDSWLLASFLKPLIHVKRLSLDWPIHREIESYPCCEYLKDRLAKLTYLSVRLRNIECLAKFYSPLQLCQTLKELRMAVVSLYARHYNAVVNLKLKNLEVIEYYGPYIREVEEHFVSIIPYPKEWTHFEVGHPLHSANGFYLERNVEVCAELLQTISIKRLSCNYPKFAAELSGFVIPACLLEDVIRIRHNAQDKFCCLTLFKNQDDVQLAVPTVYWASRLCMLKIDEVKRLLKDPRSQITCLNITHNIEQECDAHIVTAAFENLTELVLSNVIKKTLHSDQRLKRSYSASFEELNKLPDPESCFSKLVQSTPQLRHLTFIANTRTLEDGEIWDSFALCSISDWINLTSLRLWNIPVMNGEFLIEIGKQCKFLEKLELCYLDCWTSYKNNLPKMLAHCRILKEFTLRDNKIDQLPEVFSWLVNNPQLRKVCVINLCDGEVDVELVLSIKQLLRCCSELTIFVCIMFGMTRVRADDLKSTLRRLKSEINRPTFQFHVDSYDKLYNNIHEDYSSYLQC